MDKVATTSFNLAVYQKGDSEAAKLALVLPGRLDTKDYPHMRSHVDFLATRGFFALSFDPPGTWESPGGIEMYTTTNYLKSVNELIEYFGRKPTLLLGHSRGSAVAMLAGASIPSVSAIVAVMSSFGRPSSPSPDDIRRGFKISYRDIPPGAVKTKERKKFELPIAYFEDGERYDPLQALKTITKPKLLVYGTRDEFAEPDAVRKIFRELPEPKMIHELDSDHDYRYHPDLIEEVNQVVGRFLDKYLSH